MANYTEKAIELFKSGCSCSQAVTCAFADKLGEDTEQLKEDVFKYRLGMADYCGAMLGARSVANYMSGVKNREEPACVDDRSAEVTSYVTEAFRNKVGDIHCREIKGQKLRGCGGCVKDAVSILEKMFEEGKL